MSSDFTQIVQWCEISNYVRAKYDYFNRLLDTKLTEKFIQNF